MVYEISAAAAEDWEGIVNYSLNQHGEKQTLKYMQELQKGTEQLAEGEGYYKNMETLYPNMRLKHCNHHYIFGLMRKNAPMLVVAIFHERMNLMVQLKKRLKNIF